MPSLWPSDLLVVDATRHPWQRDARRPRPRDPHESILTARGVLPWRAILGRAGVQPEVHFLKVYAGDYTVLLSLEEALAGGALLARRLNGQPLTPAHGVPLRLVAPGRACWYSVKWVDRVELVAEEGATTGESLARARLQR